MGSGVAGFIHNFFNVAKVGNLGKIDMVAGSVVVEVVGWGVVEVVGWGVVEVVGWGVVEVVG